MDFVALRQLFLKWLPIFLILLLLMGMVLITIRMVLPNWQDFQTLSSDVQVQRDVVATQIAIQNDTANQIILQRSIDLVQEDIRTTVSNFLSRGEAEQVLDRLYTYAYSRGVRVVSLQAQSNTASAAGPVPEVPFEALVYQIQVGGAVSNLIDFVAHFQEASLPAVSIMSMSALDGANQTTLSMVLQFYTSPFSAGQILNQVPTQEPVLPSPTPTMTATALPTDMPTLTASPVLPSPTPTNTVEPATAAAAAAAPATLPPASPATEEVITCPNAPPTMFKVGDVAVVYFNGLGALRVLSDPNAPVMSTRTQAYDNQRLEIIAGPVCASGSYYWYIRNLSQSNALGWVAEGRGDERWLCPEANPECVG